MPWDEVVRQGRLRWIQSSAAGLDHCLVPRVVESDIIVTSASGVLANQVADHTMALLAGLLRSLPTFFRAQQKREFIRRPTRDLHGTRIGIIGLGRNGRRLAEVLSAVSHHDRRHRLVPGEQAAARGRAAAGRRRRRDPAADRHPHPGRAAHRRTRAT